MFDSGLPERRKRELQTALNVNASTVLQFFQQLLQSQYASVEQLSVLKCLCLLYSYVQYAQPGAQEHTARHQRLLLGILNAIAAYVSWVPLRCDKVLLPLHSTSPSLVFEADFDQAFCRLLPDLELRMVRLQFYPAVVLTHSISQRWNAYCFCLEGSLGLRNDSG